MNLESCRTNEIQEQIGSESGNAQDEEISLASMQMYEFNIIARCVRSLRTLANRFLWNDLLLFTVDELGLENLGVPGKKPQWLLTLKIREPSSGMVTEVKNTLLLMNFEEVSTSPMYLDGSIGTRSLWRLKDHQPLW